MFNYKISSRQLETSYNEHTKKENRYNNVGKKT